MRVSGSVGHVQSGAVEFRLARKQDTVRYGCQAGRRLRGSGAATSPALTTSPSAVLVVRIASAPLPRTLPAAPI